MLILFACWVTSSEPQADDSEAVDTEEPSDSQVDSTPDSDSDCVQHSWFLDGDGDGWGEVEAGEACEPEAGWVAQGGDCDDENDAVHPEAEESCNDVDDDCDDEVDEGVLRSWYVDGDGDGAGGGQAVLACESPDGRVERGGDCDDQQTRLTDTVMVLLGDTDITSAWAAGTANDPALLTYTGADIITVCGGPWYVALTLEDLTGTFEIKGVGYPELIGPSDRPLINASYPGADVTLATLKLKGGSPTVLHQGWPPTRQLWVHDSSVTDGVSADANGGCLSEGFSTMVVSYSEVRDCDAGTYDGGGLAGYQATVKVYSSIFADNKAANGAAMSIEYRDASLEIHDTSFDTNAASNSGGAIMAMNDTSVSLVDSSLTNNTAVLGGAIYAEAYAGITCQSTGGDHGVWGNTASTAGGGVYLDHSGAVSGATLVSTACDWDQSGTNSPNDVTTKASTHDYGDDATFTCDGYVGCTP